MDFQPKEILPEPTIIESPLLSDDRDSEPVDLDDYTVLGDTIDHEMKERIREAIMETRRASGGTNNPYVTRSVFKATSYCNRVLGRLNAPHHKRYRRDILLSLIAMHERNQAWWIRQNHMNDSLKNLHLMICTPLNPTRTLQVSPT